MREEVRRLNDCTCNKVNKYLAFECGLSRSLEGDRLFRLRVTSRFGNVPFANVSCRSAKKRNERCACICFVLSAMIQKSAIRKYILRFFQPLIRRKPLRNCPNTYAKRLQKLAERLLGEPTVNRLGGLLMTSVSDVNILILFTCFYVS